MSAPLESIGKYQIVAELGRGAMGVVYKGLDPDIHRHVAIKTMLLFKDEDQAGEVAKRFRQEARAAGRLSHRNIISVYEFGETGELEYIVMEFIEGETLEDRLKREGPPDLASACAMMVTILRALDYAHQSGVVHRDIKPANIMLTNSGEVKIADFGIARIESSELTRVGTIMGTPAYMSPEQLLGQQVDLRSDIFSAAVVFYEMLTGERAFQGANISMTSYKVIHTDLPPISKICPSLPGALDAILERALSKSPQERYGSAEEFAVAIAQLGAGGTQRSTTMLAGADDQTVIAGQDQTIALAPATPRSWPRWPLIIFVAVSAMAVAGYLSWQSGVGVPAVGQPVADIIRDCADCPEMVVIPPGTFVQGSPESEPGRRAAESPQHLVSIGTPLVISKYEITRGEYSRFVASTGHDTGACSTYEDGEWAVRDSKNWRSPGFVQNDDHPVTCVSWHDANAYVRWLSDTTGVQYRLLSSAEWEYAARAGTTRANFWIGDDTNACQFANVADEVAGELYQGWQIHNCQDGAVHTTPVNKLAGNAFGLHHTLGNVFEWVQDCWVDDYSNAPEDGRAQEFGDCSQRILRGGSWFSQPQFVRFAFRNHFASDFRASTFGFRVVRDSGP